MNPVNSHIRKLLTIITEATLEVSVIRDIERLGAHGYTVTDARGKGRGGVRDGGWAASSNVRIEVVCDTKTAEAIATHLKTHYYHDFAMIMIMSDVEVVRPEKF